MLGELDKNTFVIREIGELEGKDYSGVILEGSHDAIRAAGSLFGERVVVRASLPTEPVQVGVKELEWEKRYASEFLSRAETIIGVYRVWSHHEANGEWYWSIDGLGEHIVSDESEAKAAAQADYEQRIRSALTPAQPANFEHAAQAARKEAHDLAERVGIDMLDDHDQFIADLTATLLKFAALPMLGAGQEKGEAKAVADIVPAHCSGSAFVFSEGVLHVNKDGSGYIAVDEENWALEDDRYAGPDGAEGSVHWITRFPAGEMTALRDFLNGADFHVTHPAPASPATEHEPSLDDRMQVAGMIPLSKLLAGDTPMAKWEAHAGVKDLATFKEWLMLRHGEFMRMKVAYDLGDKDENDDLYEWVLAHAGTLSEVVSNFRAAGLMDASPAVGEITALQAKLAEIRHQNEVNIEYARREHPKDNPLLPVFEVLASHITDRLNEADALAASLASCRQVEWRLIERGETIEADDEVIADDASSWIKVDRWAVGAPYHSAFKSIRRALPAVLAEERGK